MESSLVVMLELTPLRLLVSDFSRERRAGYNWWRGNAISHSIFGISPPGSQRGKQRSEEENSALTWSVAADK
jgi:hypothetical protein